MNKKKLIQKLTQTEPIIQGNYLGFFGGDFTIIYDMTNDAYSYFFVEDELNIHQLGAIRIYILSIVNRLEHQE